MPIPMCSWCGEYRAAPESEMCALCAGHRDPTYIERQKRELDQAKLRRQATEAAKRRRKSWQQPAKPSSTRWQRGRNPGSYSK